jgi:small-conductance mechanosensitive channel
MVMTTPMANYGTGFEYIWHEIPVLVTFESNWKKAKEILLETANETVPNLTDAVAKAVRETSKRFMIFYQTFTPTVYTSVDESGVLLTVRYMCRPRERRGTSHEMWERILDRFNAEPDIEFAYPTERRYVRSVEIASPTWPLGSTGEDEPEGR